MLEKTSILILQTRHKDSISYLNVELMKAFSSDKYHVTLLYLEDGEANSNDLIAQECIFLGMSKTDYNGLRLKAKKKLRPFLSHRSFDVVIANTYKPISLLMQLANSNSASLCIGIVHAYGEFDRLTHRLAMRFMLDHRWIMVGVSSLVRKYLINARCGFHNNNTCTINNAIDVEAIRKQALDSTSARRALGLPAKGTIFGVVGRSVQGKRHFELVKAFHQFVGKRSETFLVIIGDGPCITEIRNYIQKHQLQDKVFLVGHFPQATKYLNALDIFVFPSEYEAFGIALIEAMALSLPIIVNNVEPLSTIAGEAALKVNTEDAQALVAALQAYYQQPEEKRKALGEINYQRVQGMYNITDYRDKYRRLVESYL